MSLEKNDIISSGLLELYVAGLVSEQEAKQVQAWAAQYPEVAAELEAIEQAVEAQAMAQAVQPKAQVKQNIMAAIEQQGKPFASDNETGKYVEMSKAKRGNWKWLVAASVLLLVGSIGIYLLNNQTRKVGPSVAKNTDTPKTGTKPVQNIIGDHVAMEKKMRSEAGFVKIILKKAPGAPVDCDATIFWNKQSGELYFDPCHLPNTPAGKQYQLWAIVNGKPVNGGMVITDGPPGKYVIQKMAAFTNAESFAVTLEDKGGKDKPTLEQTFVTGQA